MFKNVLSISEDPHNVLLNTAQLQNLIDEKGLYANVTSEEMTPAEVHGLYEACGISETEYMVVKSKLGYGKGRIHATKDVQTKFLTGFVAACIRYELQNAASYVNSTSNEVIQEANHLSMTKIGESYVPIQGIVGRQEDILKSLESSIDILTQIAKDENDRLTGRHPTPRHRKTGPKKVVPRKTKGDSSKKTTEKADREMKPAKQKKKPGVKPGTKRSDTNKDGTPRKKPGVAKGYKRGDTNKDGSSRKKPGPKPKEKS